MQIIFDRPTIDRAVERANAIQVRRGLYTWAKYFCQLVFLEIGSKLNLYVQYSKIEIYLEIWGFDNLTYRMATHATPSRASTDQVHAHASTGADLVFS